MRSFIIQTMSPISALLKEKAARQSAVSAFQKGVRLNVGGQAG